MACICNGWTKMAGMGMGMGREYTPPRRRRSFEATTSTSTRACTSSSYDIVAYEAQRRRLDAEARTRMSQQISDADGDSKNKWKWEIGKRVWDLMERDKVAQFPRPVHHRIPNFVGATIAAESVSSLGEFSKAHCVKVNPDSPQKQVRFLVLSSGKRLLTPQPRLRTGFFSILDPSSLSQGALSDACTAAGAKMYGKPMGLDAKIQVDLILIGSVAVDPRTGARLGKGEGFAELEYGMLRYMGAIDDSTPVITTVHDKQLVDDIPIEKLQVHDVPVDVICTPTQVIHTNTRIPKPQGIYWDKLSPEKLKQIQILRELKERIEKETGEQLPTGPPEKLPPTAKRNSTRNIDGRINE